MAAQGDFDLEGSGKKVNAIFHRHFFWKYFMIYFLRFSSYLCIAFFVFLVCGCNTYSYKQGRPNIYNLENVQRVVVLSFGNDEVTDIISEILVQHSKWKVYDRVNLRLILQEQNLQESALVDKDTAIRVGKLAGVDTVIFGEFKANRAVVKAINVETGQYITYKNEDLLNIEPMRFKVFYLCRNLLPYTIKYNGINPVHIWLGGNADRRETKNLTPSVE